MSLNASVFGWTIRGKPRREFLAKRFKDPNVGLKLVIVLTGVDVPCMHTMYVDKPMQRHGLMQAIARVNRVFKDKPGGLVVAYLGLARSAKESSDRLHGELSPTKEMRLISSGGAWMPAFS